MYPRTQYNPKNQKTNQPTDDCDKVSTYQLIRLSHCVSFMYGRCYICDILTSFNGSERSPCAVRGVFNHWIVTVIETLSVAINISYPSGKWIQSVSGDSVQVCAECADTGVAINQKINNEPSQSFQHICRSIAYWYSLTYDRIALMVNSYSEATSASFSVSTGWHRFIRWLKYSPCPFMTR